MSRAQAAQRGHDVVFAGAGLLEEAVRVADHLFEHLAVLLEDGDQRAVVDARDLLHRGADLADAGAQHLVGGFGRFERQQGLLGLLLQLGRLEVAADEQPGAASAVRAATAIHPPHSSRAVTASAMRNPPSAVMNHPEMTAITPVMR